MEKTIHISILKPRLFHLVVLVNLSNKLQRSGPLPNSSSKAAAIFSDRYQMDNSLVLRQWFDQVDSRRTDNVTASQLQVRKP